MADQRATVAELMDRADEIVEALQTLPEEDWGQLADIVQAHHEDSISKLEALGYVNRRLRSEVQILDEEIRRLKKRRDQRARGLDRVRGLAHSLLTCHLELYPGPIKTERFSIALVSASRPRLDVDPDADVPPSFLTQPQPVIDKASVRAHLEEGNALPWARLVRSSYVRWT